MTDSYTDKTQPKPFRERLQLRAQSLGEKSAEISIRWMPETFTFAVLVTVIVFLCAWLGTETRPVQIVEYWYGGFWSLLTFGMQMVLIVVTGYALAVAPPVKRVLARIAAQLGSASAAIAVTALLSGVISYVHWGLGTILSCLFAVEIAKSFKTRGIRCHFPLLVASAYSGTAVAMVGLSSSAALLMNTPGHFLEDSIGLVPLTDTIFRPQYIMIVVTATLTAAIVLTYLHPSQKNTQEMDENASSPFGGDETRETARTPGQRLDNMPMLAWLIGLVGIVFILQEMMEQGIIGIQLNVLNFFFLMLGILLHGSLKSYSNALTKGALAAAGIVLLFPFYGGVLGVMRDSGLVDIVASGFVAISTENTFALWQMISAGVLNFAIPSAGGQWAVQGPIAVTASQELGLPIDVPAMSVMLGESLTNLAQPLWLIPLLGISGLRAGQVLGYTIVLMAFLFVVFGGGLLLL
ncbi:TIGR00366 family protein [Roseovarius sp. SK2]|uniref:short-chain fatty acid transporter n=1 Tax=Roseovarius TaxID=74030 RepID=UPI00237A5E83|nr:MULTISPECIES: TIGR00366 family protein [unclassified Roseovarius]MDD9727159.1 TIGR00366 family protein [Roseovarius sp. SK2]